MSARRRSRREALYANSENRDARAGMAARVTDRGRCPILPRNRALGPVLTGGLSSPLFVTHADDGSNRLFIVERSGTIKLLRPGATSSTAFLTIPSSKVLSGGEQGLLGLAFHPDFESNRRFFVYYTRKPDGASVVAEYKASASNPSVADPTATTATEKVLLTTSRPFGNHNGGMMAFDANGYLFIASGDGGSSDDPGNRAQNVNVLLGKILRLDVDTPNGPVPYSSPPDNPYWGAKAGADEIYAIGVRNIWRMSFDRLTGQLRGRRGPGRARGGGHHHSWRQLRLARHGGDAMQHQR
jgi:glucose/arabinose dehydrogenase